MALLATKATPPKHAHPRQFGEIQPVQPTEFHAVDLMPPCIQPEQRMAPTTLQLHRHHQSTPLEHSCVPAPSPLENFGCHFASRTIRGAGFAFKPEHRSLRAATHTATIKALTHIPALGPAIRVQNTHRTVVTSATRPGVLCQSRKAPTRQPRHQWPARWHLGQPTRTFPTKSQQTPLATKFVLAPRYTYGTWSTCPMGMDQDPKLKNHGEPSLQSQPPVSRTC